MSATHIRTARRALFVALLLPMAARAAPWQSMEHGQVREGPGVGPALNTPQTSIGPTDAAAIQSYYHAQTAGGASSPTGTPRPWAIGQVLPGSVAAEPLPPDLSARVSPFYGFHYVRVGGDVLLIADGTRVVAAAMPI